MDFNAEIFAARLRGKRAEKDVAQEALARECGVSPDTIVKYEGGLGNPTASNIFALSKALGCTPDYLMGWE